MKCYFCKEEISQNIVQQPIILMGKLDPVPAHIGCGQEAKTFFKVTPPWGAICIWENESEAIDMVVSEDCELEEGETRCVITEILMTQREFEALEEYGNI